MEAFIIDVVADPLAAGHGGMSLQPHPVSAPPLLASALLLTHRARRRAPCHRHLPAAAVAGSGERWVTTTGRATVPSDLGEESEVGGGDPDDLGEESEVGGGIDLD
jgi:hypothetical protein